MKWAFSAESRQGNRYCVVAVVVETHAGNRARSAIERFRKLRQRRVHMSKESNARRTQFLDLLDGLPLDVVAVVVDLRGRSMADARNLALTGLVAELAERSVMDWRLEQMTPDRMDVDRAVIATALAHAGPDPRLEYDHFQPHADPMLWAADGYAWAVLAGRTDTVAVMRLA